MKGKHRDDHAVCQVTYRYMVFALFFFECLESSIDERAVTTPYHKYLRQSHATCSASATRRSTIDMNDGHCEQQQQQHDPVHGRHGDQTDVYVFFHRNRYMPDTLDECEHRWRFDTRVLMHMDSKRGAIYALR